MVFGDYSVNKNAFQNCKEPIDIDKIDIRKIVVSNKDSYGNKGSFKYFVGYKSDNAVLPLCIKLP